MKNYLALWDEGLPDRNSRILESPITVVGEHVQGTKSEFAKVQLTVRPAKSFDVEDCVAEKIALEKLNVGWPDPFIFGLLDVLMNAEPQPLTDVRVTLEQVWYHDADSSREAFLKAGRDAGRKIIAAVDKKRS
jgi:translation elongation factor EF-G